MDNEGSSGRDGIRAAEVYKIPGSSERREWILANSDKLGIKWDSLPKPLVFSPLFGQTNEWYRGKVTAEIMRAANHLKRPLHQHETDALSFYTAKALRTESWESPIIIGTAVAFWRRGRANYRFPFFTPKLGFDPLRFPGKRFPFLTGDSARLVWEALRLASYYAVSKLFLHPLVVSYATSVLLTSVARDPRLEEWMQQLKFEASIRNQRQNEDGTQRPQVSNYETSPTNESEGGGWGKEESERDTNDNAYYPREFPERRNVPSPGSPPYGNRSRGQQARFPESQSGADGDQNLFDDASPVAPSERQRPQMGPSSGGSAWDRIRHQTGSSGNDAQGRQSWDTGRQDPREPSSGQEYSSANTDSRDEREREQRKFDEMLEKERRGDAKDWRSR